MEMTKEEAVRILMAELEKGERSAKDGESLSLDQAMEKLMTENVGDQKVKIPREEAAALLMAELEKGRRSGREEGYIEFDEVVQSLGISMNDNFDEHNNNTTKSTICQ